MTEVDEQNGWSWRTTWLNQNIGINTDKIERGRVKDESKQNRNLKEGELKRQIAWQMRNQNLEEWEPESYTHGRWEIEVEVKDLKERWDRWDWKSERETTDEGEN